MRDYERQTGEMVSLQRGKEAGAGGGSDLQECNGRLRW